MADQSTAVIAGAGIVGICCGIELQRQGYRVCLYDPESPGSQTSSGNAGGIAVTEVMPVGAPGVLRKVPGWLLDPLGPLSIRPSHLPRMLPWLWRFYLNSRLTRVRSISTALADLLHPSRQLTLELAEQAGLSHLFTDNGALTVYRSEASREQNRLEWEIKKSNGIRFEFIDQEAVRELEPAIKQAGCGVFNPDWFNTVNPYTYTKELFDYFVAQGGSFKQQAVKAIRQGENALLTANGDVVTFDTMIVAAGVWSKPIAATLDEHVLLIAERGYNTTLKAPGININRQIIFGDHSFVISPMDLGLRIGGAVELAGPDAPPNYKRSRALVDIARRFIPELPGEGGEQWMGRRPSTPDSLPVISKSHKHPNVLYAFGHGHLGLTMAAMTGKLIGELTSGQSARISMKPFDIARF